MYYTLSKTFCEHSVKLHTHSFKTLTEVFEWMQVNYNYAWTEDINAQPVPRWVYFMFGKSELHQDKHWILVNERGTIYKLSTIKGLEREWLWNRKSSWKSREYRRSRGERKSAYGNWRHPKTLQELRTNHSLDEDDLYWGAKIRSKRRLLPTVWDDCYSHNEKNWKKQSKRKHQWKV